MRSNFPQEGHGNGFRASILSRLISDKQDGHLIGLLAIPLLPPALKWFNYQQYHASLFPGTRHATWRTDSTPAATRPGMVDSAMLPVAMTSVTSAIPSRFPSHSAAMKLPTSCERA